MYFNGSLSHLHPGRFQLVHPFLNIVPFVTKSLGMKSCILLAAVAGLASAAPQLEKRQYIDYEAVVDDYVPTITEVPGLKTQTVHYDPTAAISSAAAEVTEDPLPQKKRDLEVRSACDPEPTIANTYNIDVSSPSAFQNDPNAAAAANAAAIPSGYSRNFKALTNTVVGYGYLGYQQISSYDPQQCATRCTALAGCLGFNLCKTLCCLPLLTFTDQCQSSKGLLLPHLETTALTLRLSPTSSVHSGAVQ